MHTVYKNQQIHTIIIIFIFIICQDDLFYKTQRNKNVNTVYSLIKFIFDDFYNIYQSFFLSPIVISHFN